MLEEILKRIFEMFTNNPEIFWISFIASFLGTTLAFTFQIYLWKREQKFLERLHKSTKRTIVRKIEKEVKKEEKEEKKE